MDSRPYSGKAVEILDAAERRMRGGGFDAASFRDLAAEVGIKSASVHYHFPQKTDLGEAVVQRYADRILAALQSPDDPSESIRDRIERLCQIYRSAIMDEGLVCLCCVLGAESLDLPNPVAEAVSAYFTRLLDWTDTALTSGQVKGEDQAEPSAAQIIASLQGAMILALAMKEPKLFTDTTDRILAEFKA